MAVRNLRRNPLTDWIKFATSDLDLVVAGPCTALALVRVIRDVDTEVHTTELKGGNYTPEQLGEKFYAIAREHCKDEPGVEHRYKLLAFYGGSNQPKTDKTFAISPYGDPADTLNELPDSRGAHAQGMRHTETFFQGAVGLIKHTTMSLAEENKDLRRENREMLGVMRDMMMQMADNRFNHEMQLLTYQRQSSERQQMISFAPALVNAILGKEVFPQSTADTALIESLAGNITEEQIQKLAGVAGEGGISPEVFGPLAMRIHKAMKDKREAKEKARTHLALVKVDPNKNPEDDAAGEG